jgi:NTP pyrophosphatase (non-canonical NTP hydrolase)
MGKIAEKAKKAFRDKGGVFDDFDKETIRDDFVSIDFQGSIARHEISYGKPGSFEPNSILYPLFGLIGESGEVAGKLLKLVTGKDRKLTDEDRLEVAKECSDVLWYISALANELGYSLSDIAEINLTKLRSRRERGTIQGNGDNR